MRDSRSYTTDESENRNSGKDWSIADLEDLRDYAKVMTLDELPDVMTRSRHEIQKKLIELGLTAAKGRAVEN